ncbi:MAG: hypothetical protein V1754_05930 [Pseudomonadota bacterium]
MKMGVDMSEELTGEELVLLVKRVFSPGPRDRSMAILVDLPDALLPDNSAWKERRALAADWFEKLSSRKETLGLDVDLFLYRNVRMSNADLPSTAHQYEHGHIPVSAEKLDSSNAKSFTSIFQTHTIFLVPTELSATAPLKLAAKEFCFRAATMPGFASSMIPALRLDYTEINRRVNVMKDLLDQSALATFVFVVDAEKEHVLNLDLRYRTGHASGGLFPEPKSVGNLPSGEAYIVPYEGEQPGIRSLSAGQLPVQFGQEVVVFEIKENRAVKVEGDGRAAEAERGLLAKEPAYGNLAELGLGILTDFGVHPTGDLLLDEKLGLHIAFGRSDHFDGQVGASEFSTPEAVVHIDRVYLPSTQPRILVVSVDLQKSDGTTIPIIRNGRYVVDFLVVE